MSDADTILDYDSLTHLLQGDANLIKMILESFFTDTQTQIDILEQALNDNDVETAQKQAHKIKGSSANVRAIAMNQITIEMDLAGKAGEIDSIKNRLADLKQAFATMKAHSQQYLD